MATVEKQRLLLYILQVLRDRLMVGHVPLEHGILVRIQVPQQ